MKNIHKTLGIFLSVSLSFILSQSQVIAASISQNNEAPSYAKNINNHQFRGQQYLNLADVVEKVMPAVVNISVIQKRTKSRNDEQYNDELQEMLREFLERRFGNPDGGEPEGRLRKPHILGTGFLIDPTGYIVTNNHVVDGAEEISVTLNDVGVMGYKAKLIGQDKRTDIALIKIESKEKLPYLTFDNVSKIRVGDPVFAVGNPFGLGGTVTQGIISAKSRSTSANGLGDDIQTDAAINRGNSGGPLCNSTTGKVIGVNSAIVTTTGGSLGIGFAVPASIVQPVVEQLKQHGKVVRGWLGVKVQIVDDNIAKSIGLDKPIGGLIAEVVLDSPAAKAGLQVGDVIIKLNGEEIVTMNRLPKIVSEIPIGTKVNAEVFRNGKLVNIAVIIEKPEKSDPFSEEDDEGEGNDADAKEQKIDNLLGVKVDPIDEENKEKYSVKGKVNGVIISKINPKSLGSSVGLKVGDVIMRINQKAVNSPESFYASLKEIAKNNKKVLMLLIMRGNMKSFITIETEQKNDVD